MQLFKRKFWFSSTVKIEQCKTYTIHIEENKRMLDDARVYRLNRARYESLRHDVYRCTFLVLTWQWFMEKECLSPRGGIYAVT